MNFINETETATCMHIIICLITSMDIAGDTGKLYGSGTQLQHSSRRQMLPPPISSMKDNAGAMCKMLPNTEYVPSALYVPTCIMDTFFRASRRLSISCPAEHMTNDKLICFAAIGGRR